MKRARPLVVGEVLFDRFDDGSEVLGGAPFNVAWHLQAFGAAPLFVSRIGSDGPGERVLARMRSWGMRTDGVQIDPALPTGEVRVTLDDGEPSYEIAHPAAWDAITRDDVPEVEASLLYHGTLALRDERTRATVLALRDQLDIPAFVDVNLRAPWWDRDAVVGWVRGAYGVKLNRDELDALTPEGQREPGPSTLRHLHAHTLIVTMGEQGAMACTAAGEQAHAAPDDAVTVVDTVGAGDAFASVLLLGHLHRWPLDVTLERAQRFASRVVGVRGATALAPAAYADLKRDWRIDSDS